VTVFPFRTARRVQKWCRKGVVGVGDRNWIQKQYDIPTKAQWTIRNTHLYKKDKSNLYGYKIDEPSN